MVLPTIFSHIAGGIGRKTIAYDCCQRRERKQSEKGWKELKYFLADPRNHVIEKEALRLKEIAHTGNKA